MLLCEINALKELYTHPFCTMYMYYYITQQNKCLRVNASVLSC
jgi:hypothetical protein